jgi:hypothetical protein
MTVMPQLPLETKETKGNQGAHLEKPYVLTLWGFAAASAISSARGRRSMAPDYGNPLGLFDRPRPHFQGGAGW